METVLYDKRNRMAFVTLNRPERKNAIDPDMHQDLCHIWADFRDDDDVDVAILRGAGDAFCSGADLASYVPANYVDATPSRVREIVDLGLGGLTRGLHKIRKPVIASVNGWALAAGLELALACDLRVASDRAMFGSFEARRGFHHGDGGITRLVNTCGVGVAMQLVLTAEPIDAARAVPRQDRRGPRRHPPHPAVNTAAPRCLKVSGRCSPEIDSTTKLRQLKARPPRDPERSAGPPRQPRLQSAEL